MKTRITNLLLPATVVLLGLTSITCTKEETTLEPKPSYADNLKIIDTVYGSVYSLIADLNAFPSIKEFLEQQSWKTSYDKTYSVVANRDTTYIKERLAGYKWTFYVFTYPPPGYTGNIIQKVKDGDMGVRFSISGDTLELEGAGEYLMDSPTMYTDSTFSLLLKHTETIDSITRTQVIKLQSSP